MRKSCFKCKQEKDISEFYVHPQMADGHLGKCIECTKKDIRLNGKTDVTRDRERKRNSLPERIKAITKRTAVLNNALRDGRINKPSVCSDCGKQGKLHAHHEDYSKPLIVNWLCVSCHGKRNPNYVND